MKIQELTLYSRNLPRQKSFYQNTLGLEITQETDTFFEITTQNTLLRFEEKSDATPYHFAFNIPSEKEEEVMEWLQQKVKILPFQGEKLVDFSAWNAKAMYFKDMDGNIVEFISRRNLQYPFHAPFDVKQLWEVSEIGMPTKRVSSIYGELKSVASIDFFDGDRERFLAAGGEHGLFIIIDYQQKDWIPTDDKALPSAFRCTFESNGKVYEIEYKEEKIIWHKK
ncbi:VOC family protein [Algivirga pacifica]|uniref:VOC domain-containing protein n=1 Tax=Algivirga pacifica TaxID=1162670 RepID=A0ABP9DK01_9BACT